MGRKGMGGGGREGGRERRREGGRRGMPEKTISAAPHLNDFATFNDRITNPRKSPERVGM